MSLQLVPLCVPHAHECHGEGHMGIMLHPVPPAPGTMPGMYLVLDKYFWGVQKGNFKKRAAEARKRPGGGGGISRRQGWVV